jgi:heme/copper-type cytochrome/quinol oxidase subunit 4
MKQNQAERIAAFYLAAIITVVVIGSMIIIHEESTEFKDFLINLTGHHWVTKSVFAIVIFLALSIVFYFMFRSEKLRKALRTDNVWLWSVFTVIITVIFILGSLLIYILYFYGG